MRHILVTGGNKGIGLAIVEAILAEHSDTFVHMGSRDLERGRAAAARLTTERPELGKRLDVVALDVADDRSVADAARTVENKLAGERLYGIVNNAGIGSSGGDLEAVLETNVLGIRRVCEAFLALLEPKGGRIVNVTSASGPMFVAACSDEKQRFFVDAQISWPMLRAFIDDCLEMAKKGATAFAANGLGDGSPYGLSKACANAYTVIVAREHPALRVNACTPGFIATDMTRHYAESAGKSPADLGMKTPADGARAPMHLLFGTLEGNGRFYGSDAKRSPLDRYRAPGSNEYTGS
ncbi:MAG: SDR family NAD(P)-dependent oxidoreductase [Polyangiaceae bacterium]|nr:SDR family NAD(P)-dependent oxidoreductase [Polyangiaceae bacterium]